MSHTAASRDAAILYSGGTDSSLVAYRAAQEFGTVHLLTFSHPFQFDIEKSTIGYQLLAEKFPGKFTHEIIDIEAMFWRVYKRNRLRNLLKYKTLNMLFGCFSCQACFHINTIIYCLTNGIHEVHDGSNSEYGDFSPMQIEMVIREIDRLYEEYGLAHKSPGYHEHKTSRSDEQLFDLGICPERNVKGDMETYLKYQGFCKLGSCSAVGLYFWKRCKGYPDFIQKSLRDHWLEEVPFFKRLIEEAAGEKIRRSSSPHLTGETAAR